MTTIKANGTNRRYDYKTETEFQKEQINHAGNMKLREEICNAVVRSTDQSRR